MSFINDCVDKADCIHDSLIFKKECGQHEKMSSKMKIAKYKKN